MVHDHTAVLHGDVATESDRDVLEAAVRKVSGVHEVDCRLHVGLLPSDTQPSQSRAFAQPSAARLALEAAARRGGSTGPPGHAVRAVLATFLGRIPPGERDQVLAHLPADVRSLTTSDAKAERLSRLATVHALLDRRPVPELSLDGAREHLDLTEVPWVFHRDTETRRGAVLYRRDDGHYGWIGLADERPESPR